MSLNCNFVSIFCVFFGPNFALQKASAFPPFGVFSREISRFFFLFCSPPLLRSEGQKRKLFVLSTRSRAGASFSSFLSFSFLSADLMRAILFYEERSGRGRVLVRENLPLERDEFALYTRELEMRKTNSSLVFFLNPSKKRKKVPARSKSLHARALSHGEREEARGEKTVEIYRVPLRARVRVLFIRASSFFFLLACVLFARAWF